MTNDRIDREHARLNEDRLIQNFIAQANARYILLNTAEDREAFPPYTIDDSALNMLALQYLNLGCCMAENERLNEAIVPLEKGASILETVHGAQNNQQQASRYYGLVASLAYYVSFQYSKSFILIRKFESTTPIASCIRYFLLRDFRSLNERVYNIIFDQQYSDEVIARGEEQEGSLRIYEFVIAKALNGFVTFLLTGNHSILNAAKQQLLDLKEIADLENDPGIWWVVRLLLLISDGFNNAAVWNVLSVFFDIENEQVRSYIRSLVYLQPGGIYELFITQRRSLKKVLNEGESGCIVSIPTSSGKTRIAEIAILHSIQKEPTCKVLYIAPFRSLAFEIENSMERVFENAGIVVSHLYGGSTYSQLDEMAIDEASLIIATPEKAKAILRGNIDFVRQIKLAIIDEGHLLGGDKRLVMNEMFYEELRYYMRENNGRFLLLSAVLPNAEDLAQWLTGSSDTVYRENWRPSDERIGILEWNGGSRTYADGVVNLKWESLDAERPSFNNKFIVQKELPRRPYQRSIKFFPGDKNEAVAATAYRLRSFGTVLIYVGLKPSVFTMAEAYSKVLGDDAADHPWKQVSDWRAFELACIETYGTDHNKWLRFARKGILCHNGDLHADVRLPLERLMRSDKPLVIISTSTLGQGVNLGVSSVIFSTLFQAGKSLNERDFWNIAGRAGRAFVDHEGKILVAADITGLTVKKKENISAEIRRYFDKNHIGIAQSGIMLLIRALKKVAQDNGVDFELLLTLISENRINEINQEVRGIDEVLDWIDDTLLSLLLSHNPEGDIDVTWAEVFFARSLAAIQAAKEQRLTTDQVARFLRFRIVGIATKVGTDRSKWQSIVKSGIPLNSDLMLEDRLSDLLNIAEKYKDIDRTIENRIALLIEIEGLIKELPVLLETDNYLAGPAIDQIRSLWLTGASNNEIFKLENGMNTVTKLYAFSLPWVLNGIAKKMRNLEREEEAGLIEELSILVEAGLPSILKVKIYQAGIRSRVYAGEISVLFNEDEQVRSISSFRKDLIRNIDLYKSLVSDMAAEWLDLLSHNADRRHIVVNQFNSFVFDKTLTKAGILLPKKVGEKQYLVSPDLTFVYKVPDDSIDFSSVCNIPGIQFEYSDTVNEWVMVNNNPYVQIIE